MTLTQHTFNAFATLYQAFSMLRTGGTLIFVERIVKQAAASQVFHPVRLNAKVFNDFLSTHFDEYYRLREGPGIRISFCEQAAIEPFELH